jgi:hypothetical protein
MNTVAWSMLEPRWNAHATTHQHTGAVKLLFVAADGCSWLFDLGRSHFPGSCQSSVKGPRVCWTPEN